MEHEEDPVQLSEEVLNAMELLDIAAAEKLSLSINALAGSEGDDCFRLRTLVGNQVMLILVDSGSSHCFINANMVDRIQCSVTDTTPISVKVANGEYMSTSKSVHY
jgi:predicted aspartyl protease